MEYILRDYQQKAVDAGLGFFNNQKNKKNGILVLPTGSGKSLVIANIAKQLNGNVVIFQPSKELLEQNYGKYISYGEFAEVYSASAGRKKISHVTFATIGSVVNKPELFNDFQYCIVDECHLVSPSEGTMYNKFFSQLKLKVLGLTATPVRMKRYNFPYPHAKICMLDRMRPKFFSEYLHITQISEMKQNKFFADIDYISFDFNDKYLKLNSTGGDYTEHSMTESIKNNSVLQNVINTYNLINEKGIIRHILIFTASIDDAYYLQSQIGSDFCGVVTGTTPKKDRERLLINFKSGKLKVMANVGVLTTGFDFPELDCIIGARPTMSLALYYQIIGRCVRPHKDKTKAYVFDFVGNFKKFGKVENLVIENKNGWMIHNGVSVLTNCDISEQTEIPEVKKEAEKSDKNNPIINFGKHKGSHCSDIPKNYLIYCYDNFDRNTYNEPMFRYVEQNLLIKE